MLDEKSYILLVRIVQYVLNCVVVMLSPEEQKFIEKFGLFFEKSGRLSRIGGKIFAYLLISDPPEQSAKQICRELNIAKSSFSTNINLLIERQAVRESTRPGERSTYYEFKADAWEELFIEGLQKLTAIRGLFSEGKLLLKGKKPSNRKRLDQLDEFYAFFENEIPFLVKKWRKRKV